MVHSNIITIPSEESRRGQHMVHSSTQLISGDSINIYRYRYVESKGPGIQEDGGYDIQIVRENEEEMIDLVNDSMM